ncbi:MAG: phage portal protein [Alphaproteobacteria bacterium]|nr:MAG: phage portal protein [Alphaproteobacteria bacterium]
MNLLNRLFQRSPERRAQDVSWQALAALSPAGAGVNARLAENLSTVLACVSAISSAIASVPAWVFLLEDQGRSVAKDHPVMRLIRRGPNQHQTWPDFIEWLYASALLRGNGLAEIMTDARGRVIGLTPIPWEHVSVQLLPNGRLVYDVTPITSISGGTGRSRRLLQHEVLHLRDRSDDGLVGRSRLQRAAATVRAGLSVQDFASAIYDNGAHPSGVLEADGKLSPEALAHLRAHFKSAFSGPKNAAKAMVLDQGLKWKSVSISPEDAELLASRRFTVEELARVFGCPPPIIGDLSHGTFTNSETAGRWFAMHTMLPWLRKLEAEFARSVFSESESATHQLEFDLTGFLRGDPETRWKSHEIGVRNGILTPNEVRLAEGWNPREEGEQLRQPQPQREAAS